MQSINIDRNVFIYIFNFSPFHMRFRIDVLKVLPTQQLLYKSIFYYNFFFSIFIIFHYYPYSKRDITNKHISLIFNTFLIFRLFADFHKKYLIKIFNLEGYIFPLN